MTGPLLIRIRRADQLPTVVDAFGIGGGRPVLVIVGGAGGMSPQISASVSELFTRRLIPILERTRAAVVDGGTDSGVMRLLGRARTAEAATFPLVGVAAVGTISGPESGLAASERRASAEPGHTHLVLVPGANWGDETPWLSSTAQAIAGEMPSATLLINGGSVSLRDAVTSLSSDRPLLVLRGSGRLADAIADAKARTASDPEIADVARSPLTRVISMSDRMGFRAAIEHALSEPVKPRPSRNPGQSR